MSSLSGESREARIAEIEKDVCTPWVLLGKTNALWLISELRDALTREAALQKDAEQDRVDVRHLELALREVQPHIHERCNSSAITSLEWAIACCLSLRNRHPALPHD
jgi:hypothetical protein